MLVKNSQNRSLQIMCLVLLILVLIIEPFTKEKSDEISEELIIKIQKFMIDNFGESCFTYLLYINKPAIVIPMGVIYYEFANDKFGTIYIVIFFAMSTSLCSLLKIVYSEERPFMRNPSIETTECGVGMGKPSGIAFLSSVFLFFVFIYFPNNCGIRRKRMKVVNLKQNFNHKKNICSFKLDRNKNLETKNKEREERFARIRRKKNFFIKGLIFFILFSFNVFVGFTRIILGYQTINQIFVGWIYGGVFIIIYFWTYNIVQAKFIHLIKSKPKSTLGYYLFILQISYSFLSWLIFYLFSKNHDQLLNEQLSKYCTQDTTTETLFNKSFLDSGFAISFSFGFLYALFFHEKYIALECFNPSKKKIFSKNYSELSSWKKFIRFILVTVVIAVIYFSFDILDYGDNVYSRYFVKFYFKGFFLSFIWFYVLPKMLRVCRADVDGDLFQYTIEKVTIW